MTETDARVEPTIQPLYVDPAALSEWDCGPSWQFRLASAWTRYAPRAKGWMPRQLSKFYGPGVRDTVRTNSGARLAVEPSTLDTYTAIAASGGRWEYHVLDACARLLRDGGTFYDIGANVGIMTTDIAKRFGNGVGVYSFEPQPKLARAVAVSARLNGFDQVHVYSVMLGETPGTGELFVPSHSIHASAVSREAGAKAVPCPVTTVDRLVETGVMPPPTLIKIDVEGAELMVFKGAVQTLQAHRPVIVFESDNNARRFGYTRRQLCDLLFNAGRYRFYVMDGQGVTPADAILDREDDANLIAVPAERSLDARGDWAK